MNLLCFDTTSPALVLALCEGEALRAGSLRATGGKHAELLLPEIERLLDEADMAREAVDAVGVTLGPGAFTSARVGLATAKGLCLGRGRALYATSTLRALAHGERRDDDPPGVAVVTRAYRGEVYAALFMQSDAGIEDVLAPFHATPEDAAACLWAAGREAHLGRLGVLGEGLALAPDAFGDPERFLRLPAERDALSPDALARALLDEVRGDRRRDVVTLEPDYLRPPDAALPAAG